jgi:hypothetical protein
MSILRVRKIVTLPGEWGNISILRVHKDGMLLAERGHVYSEGT